MRLEGEKVREGDACRMETVNPRPLQALPFEEHDDDSMQVPIEINGNEGGFEVEDVTGGGGEAVSGGEGGKMSSVNADEKSSVVAQRTSELTISFEGEVYVFHAVTPDKVSAHLSFGLLYCVVFSIRENGRREN